MSTDWKNRPAGFYWVNFPPRGWIVAEWRWIDKECAQWFVTRDRSQYCDLHLEGIGDRIVRECKHAWVAAFDNKNDVYCENCGAHSS